jgi:hypothetical protein
MILLARTTLRWVEVSRERADGVDFLVDLHQAVGKGLTSAGPDREHGQPRDQ